MGARENKIERYLHDQITLLGGTTRKWVSPGSPGVPDKLVLIKGVTWMVEVKTPDGQLSEVQIREHARLVKEGFVVWVASNYEEVDHFCDIVSDHLMSMGRLRLNE